MLLSAPSLRGAANETPKRRTAAIFATHPSSQIGLSDVETWLGAENYPVAKYAWGGDPAATLANLKAISDAGFGVLYICTHGSPTELSVEDFAGERAARAAVDAYKTNPAFQSIRNEIRVGQVDDPGKRFALVITSRGLSSLFGANSPDPYRCIVVVAACNSWKLEMDSSPQPFGATEYVGCDADIKGPSGSRVRQGFCRMGGGGNPAGYLVRPVIPAFRFPQDLNVRHRGPGNTTLAPACTAHLPTTHSVLPLDVPIPGSTTYDTGMRVSNPDIMSFYLNGCGAEISKQAWVDGRHHGFFVTARQKGRLVFEVKPTVAVSQNNENWLVGNLYKVTVQQAAVIRTRVDDCPFGVSGLDSEVPFVPPQDPYRWCVWCGEEPIPPAVPGPGGVPQPPQGMDDAGGSLWPTPWGDAVAFVLYQGSPGPNTIIEAFNLPPNMWFEQVGDWYGHVIFQPDISQVGQHYDVLFISHDDNGPRAECVIQWEVVERHDELAVYDPLQGLPFNELGTVVTRPGDTGEYEFLLSNNGNTLVRDISLTPDGLLGPECIPPASIAVEPGFVELLQPGEVVPVQMTVQTTSQNLVGPYVGQLALHGDTNVESTDTIASFELRINNPPSMQGPTEEMRVVVGRPVDVSLTVTDPDGDALAYYMELGPLAAELIAEGDQLRFTWEPAPEDAGRHAFEIVADDGYERAAYELWFDVVLCHTPFADADHDGDVDQVDFAIFQTCLTTGGGSVTRECHCFDRDNDGAGDDDIGMTDYMEFAKCASGPSVLWMPALTPDCNP